MIESMKIEDITKEAVTIRETASFKDALSLMVNRQTNSLLVVNADNALVGIVDVTDLLDAIVPEYLDNDTIAANFVTEEMFEESVTAATDMPVKEFMSTDIQPVHVKDSLMAIAETAIQHKTAQIPIVDQDNRPLGFVSRRGLKHMLALQLNIKDSA